MAAISPPRPSASELSAARDKLLPDLIHSALRVLFVGINPGLYSAATGHHFARPGNRFWPALHHAGLTPRLFRASEDRELLTLSLGLTNVVARTSARADELTLAELLEGRRLLEEKLLVYKPQVVALLGVTAYRSAFQQPRAQLGRQAERLAGSVLYVLPNPSGLNAHHQLPALARCFAELKASF